MLSDNDRIVRPWMVKAHATQAQERGYRVRMVNFGRSGHVAHAKEFPERYWREIRDSWDEEVVKADQVEVEEVMT